MSEKWEEISIEYIEGFSRRVTYALERNSIKTLGQLVELCDSQILDMPGLATKALNEIQTVLGGCGLKLRQSTYDGKKYSQEEIKKLVAIKDTKV